METISLKPGQLSLDEEWRVVEGGEFLPHDLVIVCKADDESYETVFSASYILHGPLMFAPDKVVYKN